MIFVTVGTHEQPFNRLIKTIDLIKHKGIIKEDVFLQIGYSTYIPKYCEYKRFLSPSTISKLMDEASIIITHGGPSSFVEALQHNKMPIVVPRQKKFNEHVNDHQLSFCRELHKRGFPIKVVEDEGSLYDILGFNNTHLQNKFKSNNKTFNSDLESLVNELFNKRKNY